MTGNASLFTSVTIRAGALVTVAAALLTAACGSSPPAPRAAAMAYMAAHPARPVPGMTAGVILTLDDAGFAGAAAAQAHCPARLTAVVHGQMGNLPGCGAWTATAVTAAGRTVSLACGDIARRVACPPWLTSSSGDAADDFLIPEPGDYVRFQQDGQIRATTDLQAITEFAVGSILGSSPNPASPWVTTRAGGA